MIVNIVFDRYTLKSKWQTNYLDIINFKLKMNISFIIPCLNCSKFIGNTIKRLHKKLKRKRIIDYEIILIDDGSTDETFKILKKYASKKIRIIRNKKNIGKSASLIKGIKLSKMSKIVLIDCDLPYFNYFELILRKLDKEKFIYINRKSEKSKLIGKNLNLYQIARFFIGRIICLILNIFFFDKNIGDTQAGLKAFSKPKNFNKIQFVSKKFFLDAELMILFNRSNIDMISIPVNYKIYTNSSIKILSIENFIYLFELTKIIFYYNFFKKKLIKL